MSRGGIGKDHGHEISLYEALKASEKIISKIPLL